MGNQNRWWHTKDETLRKDVFDALTALRQFVENQGNQVITLSHMDIYRQRELTSIQTTRVGEWTFGYRVMATDADQGFYIRSVFAKLHGGRLDELNKQEREQIIDAVANAVLDKGSEIRFEAISPIAFVIHQPFAVTFLNELNPNIVTPSKELILGAGDVKGIGDN
jgi:hypothetical protein